MSIKKLIVKEEVPETYHLAMGFSYENWLNYSIK